jgi:citrate lyase subunit beta / citryl-CoA lyase
VLVMGTNDLAKELHAEHVPGRQPLLTGLGCACWPPGPPAR